MNLFETIFSESSIHCFPLVVSKDRHILERLFWLSILIASAATSAWICMDQWGRYQNTPVFLSLETDYRNWEYEPTGITMCSDYADNATSSYLAGLYFGIDDMSTEEQEYFTSFLKTIALARFNNLESFKRYVNDSRLYKINMLEVADAMREALFPLPEYYINVATDMGICMSTTRLYFLQSVHGYMNGVKNIEEAPQADTRTFHSIDTAQINAKPLRNDDDNVYIYIHDVNDVMVGGDTFMIQVELDKPVEITLAITQTVASENMKTVSKEKRGCYFDYESDLKFYPTKYTKNMCLLNCRAKRAEKLCGCIPFFYTNVHPHQAKTCTTNGLFCLSKFDWYDVSKCDCSPLCEEIRYHQTEITVFESKTDSKFDRLLAINLEFPKTRLKKSILFTRTDLLVSFGGAAALFLGCSFLSAFEIVFFLFEYVLKIVVNRWQSRRNFGGNTDIQIK